MTQAQWAIGTQLQRGDGADPENFATVAKINNISGPNFSLDIDDTTDLDSPGGWEEVIPTILRSGEVVLDLSFLPDNTSQLGLIEDMFGRILRNFQMIFPDTAATTWLFSAYVVGFELDEKQLHEIGKQIHLNKYKFKVREGFDFDKLNIPERIYETEDPTGQITKEYIHSGLKYAQKLIIE